MRSGDQQLWLTFFPGSDSDPLANGFGALSALNEGVLEPEGNMLTYARGGSEVITYVIEGMLSHQDRGQRARLIRAGEFQCSSASHNERSIFSNASGRDGLHVLQLSLCSKPGLPSVREPQQMSFSPPVREERFCLVGSADGRHGSLALGQDVLLYSCMLPAAKAFSYPFAAGRLAWLQVLSGEVECGSTLLRAGDGAGFSLEQGLSLRAVANTEIVLLDLKADAPGWSAQAELRARGEESFVQGVARTPRSAAGPYRPGQWSPRTALVTSP